MIHIHIVAEKPDVEEPVLDWLSGNPTFKITIGPIPEAGADYVVYRNTDDTVLLGKDQTIRICDAITKAKDRLK